MTPSEPRFRVVRALAGSRGSEQDGKYILEDPRTVFYAPDDKQVIVYFEWEGPVGHHRFEGLWKNPEGKVVVVSDFAYEAREERFAGYWTLLLSEATPPGLWALEARVDGELAGVHTFQIVSNAPPPSTATNQRVLSPSEIYERALTSAVFIEKVDATGRRFGVGSGIALGGSMVLTAFQIIDGATSLRLLLPDGQRVETDQVVAWNRRQDWAILRSEAVRLPALDRAEPTGWSVGDRCYSLDTPAELNRVIVDGNIIGNHNFPGAGARLNLSFFLRPAALGGPLLDEYGKLIGVVGGSLVPGSYHIEDMHLSYLTGVFSLDGTRPGSYAVPISGIPVPAHDAEATRLDELARTGQFVPPLARDRNIVLGRLARGVERDRPLVLVSEGREFSRQDQEIAAIVTWNPQEKRKAPAYLRVYNLDNRLLAESKHTKVKLKPGSMFDTSWKINISQLPPGIYRIDVMLEADPAWRTFMRIVD